MQTESFNVGGDLAAGTQAAAVLGRLEEQQRSAWPEGTFITPRTTAITGLAVAIPLSISMWTLIGAIFWLLAR